MKPDSLAPVPEQDSRAPVREQDSLAPAQEQDSREPVVEQDSLASALDRVAMTVTIRRLTSMTGSDLTPIWNPNHRCWEESDAQLRERIKGTPR